MAGRSGSPARSQVAVVLAWQVTGCANLLALCGYRVLADSARVHVGGFKLFGGGPLQLAAAPPVSSVWGGPPLVSGSSALPRRTFALAGDALGGAEFCMLVCAGQAVLRTVSVAVRAMGRLNARAHGHIADSVGAANAERRRFRRSAAI